MRSSHWSQAIVAIIALSAVRCSGEITGVATSDSQVTSVQPPVLPGTGQAQGGEGSAAGAGGTPQPGSTAGSSNASEPPPAAPGPGTAPTIPNLPPGVEPTEPPPVEPPVEPPPGEETPTEPPLVPVCKRGIAIADATLTNVALRPGIAWWYNWGSGTQQTAAGLEFVPMVWGAGFDVGDVSDNIPNGASFLLGFNEPNFFEQADLSASAAAALWPQMQQIAQERGLALVSPGVNFCGDDANKTGPCHDTNPVDYLSDFFAACQGCTVDYVAVHWYNCDTASLTWYLDQFEQFGKPIWLTEFACAYGGDRSVAGQEAYMRQAIPLLDNDPNIHRYSWFSGDAIAEAKLLDNDGNLTPLGEVYASLPQSNCL